MARTWTGRAIGALRHMPHYVWVGAILIALLWALHHVSLPSAVPQVVNVTEAVAFVPSGLEGVRRQVLLPHILDDDQPAWRDRVDYELAWPPQLEATGHERWAMLLPRVATRFRVLLNGQEIHQVGWYAPPSANINTGWFPHLVVLPSALMLPRSVDNHLVVQVQARQLKRSGLWPLQIGAYDALFKRHAVLELWQVTGTWMMVIASLMMGIMSWFLWRALRERLFVWMAAASFTHALRLYLSVVLEPPLGDALYFLLHGTAFTWYVAFFCLIMEELFGLRLRLVRWLAYFLLAVGPCWMSLVLWLQDYDYYRVWAGLLALVTSWGLGLMVYKAFRGRQPGADQILVLLVALFTLLTGLRDFAVVQLNFPGDADIRWMAIGSLALTITLGWVLLQRATASAREVHRLNGVLAGTVARREAELQMTFDRLRQAERQNAVESERRRLMRDMHDGLGSQLVQTLNMVRSAPTGVVDRSSVESMVGHALEELRITLDSLEPMEGDLATILGTLRQRIAPALQAAGIELQWQVQDVPPLEWLESRGVMHLFRCVQEVFANVVKHAQARRVTVRTWAEQGVVYLSIEDDGVGLPGPEDRGRGRGMSNIRTRAEKLEVQVRFYPTWPGTGVEFAFPLRRDAEEPGWAVTDSPGR